MKQTNSGGKIYPCCRASKVWIRFRIRDQLFLLLLFAIRIMESLAWRSGLFGPAGEFASEVERL